MLAHYIVANVGYKVAPHRFQIAGWWPLIFHPKACCLQSGPYKVAFINHNACNVILMQELEHEITVLNTPEFKWGINWSTTLQHMIEDNQHRYEKAGHANFYIYTTGGADPKAV